MELIKEVGAFAGLVAFLGLAVLAMLSFAQGRDLRRLREWAGSAPERDAERKETTSAAAAERAAEMRKLEAARDAEGSATDLREQRRERFSGGGGGIGGRFGEPRYLVAIFVVLALVAGGVAFAVFGRSGDEAGGKSGNGGKQASRTIKPGEIEVTVLNGTAVDGLAGTYGDMVERRGFKLGAVTNSRSSFADSVVMFESGNGRAAHRVATSLEISRVRPMTSEIASLSAGAPVAIVIGEDNASASP